MNYNFLMFYKINHKNSHAKFLKHPYLYSEVSQLFAFFLITISWFSGKPEVLALLDQANNPFPKRPPQYIRSKLYKYHFTKSEKDIDWWTREEVGEYSPPFSKVKFNIHFKKNFRIRSNLEMFAKNLLRIWFEGT